jgi:hypothetical protein
MAICSPYEPPRFITAAERADENIGNAVKAAEASGFYTQVREGGRAEFVNRATSMLKEVLPFSFDDLLKYYQKEGIIRVDPKLTKAANDGAPIYTANPRLNPDQVALAARVTKSYLMSTAVATQEMARAFLLKVKAGEDALQEGLAFARQMQHTSRFGGFVLGWDQQMGRAVANQADLGVRATRAAERAAEVSGEEASRLSGYTDLFKDIAAKMNNPDTMGEAVNDLIGLARRVEFLEDPVKIAKVSTSMQIAGNAWREVFINGLLSGPATFMANAAGMGWAIARPLIQYGAASSYAALGLPGTASALQAAAEAGASLAAINGAWGDAWQLAKRAFTTESSIYQARIEKGIDSVPLDRFLEQRGMAPLDDGLAQTIDIVGQAIRLPSRFLLGTDEFAKHLTVRGEVASRAIKRAIENGVDLTDHAAVQKYMQQEGELAFHLHSPDVQDKYRLKSIYDLENGIMAEADKATFQEDNAWANKVSQALNVPVVGPMLRPMVPFVRTPLNILKQGFVESTGLGAAINVARTAVDQGGNPTATLLALQRQMLEDPGETFRVGGQIAVTSIAAAAMYAGVMNGTIIGGGPGRWTGGGRASAAQRAYDGWLAENGLSRYSIIVGDQSIPFDRFGEPISIVLRMVADAGMYSSYANYASQEEWLAGITGIMVSGLYQASFLQGLQDVMSVLTDPQLANGGGRATRAVQNWVATQTPFGGLLNYVRRVEDPYRRAYSGASFIEAMRVHEDFYGSIFGRLNDRLPGVGKAPVMVDQLTGKPVPIMPGHGPNGLNPLQMAIPFAPRQRQEGGGPWSIVWQIKGSYQEKRPDKVRLSNAEQQEYNSLMATTKIGGRTVQEFIEDFSRRSDVRDFIQNRARLRVEAKTAITDEFDRGISKYAAQAWTELLQRNDNVSRRYLLQEAADARLEANDLEGADRITAEIDSLFRAIRGAN